MKFSAFSPLATLLLPTLLPLPAGAADTLGNKPVTVIIPLVAGGANDAELRLYFNEVSGKILPQQFTMDFKPGAASTIGSAYVVRSAPDGHTLQLITSSFTTIPATIKDVSFDTMKDYTHITQMSQRQYVLAVPAAMPANTMAEFIAYSKANPGTVNWGTSGAGGALHLSGAWLYNLINAKPTFVHYKGAAQATTDLIAGRVDALELAVQQTLPLVKAGKLKALALLSSSRSSLLPGVPAISELVPGFTYVTYTGLSGPAGMSPGVVKQLNEAFVKAVRTPAVTKELESQGSVPVGSSPAEFTKLLQDEMERWKKVVKDNNIQVE